MNRKILLVAINAKYIHSNLAVYSLKAYAKECAQNIEIAEYTINNQVEDIIDGIYTYKPDVLAFSCYIWNIEYVRKAMAEIHKLLPQCHIWLGGPEVSYNTAYYMKEYDYLKGIFVGEGEATFRDIAMLYETECDLENIETKIHDIAGIVTHKRDEAITREAVNMSEIPFVYGHLDGDDAGIDRFKNRIIYYESSRGCPYSCSYCLSCIDKKLRFRDIELVEAELTFFLQKRVPQVKFIDRTFNCDRERSARIWKFIADNDNGITNFHFEISAELVTDEHIEILNSMRPGLVQLEIGVQSTNPKTLSAIRRRMDVQRLKHIVGRLSEKKNIHIHLDLIAGLPYEDMESFKQSFNDVYSMKPDELQLGFLKVLYGSYMYDDARRYGIVYKSFPPYEVLYTDWLTYDDILRLKQVEEVLEIYYGSGQFVYTVRFFEKYFDTPYEFYEQLGAFYGKRFANGEKHSRIERYDILLEFARECNSAHGKSIDVNILTGLMTLDIYLRENIKSRPAFATSQEIYRQQIKEFAREHNISKSSHIEVFSADIVPHAEEIFGEVKANISDKNMLFVTFDYDDRNPINHNAHVYVNIK